MAYVEMHREHSSFQVFFFLLIRKMPKGKQLFLYVKVFNRNLDNSQHYKIKSRNI